MKNHWETSYNHQHEHFFFSMKQIWFYFYENSERTCNEGIIKIKKSFSLLEKKRIKGRKKSLFRDRNTFRNRYLINSRNMMSSKQIIRSQSIEKQVYWPENRITSELMKERKKNSVLTFTKNHSSKLIRENIFSVVSFKTLIKFIWKVLKWFDRCAFQWEHTHRKKGNFRKVFFQKITLFFIVLSNQSHHLNMNKPRKNPFNIIGFISPHRAIIKLINSGENEQKNIFAIESETTELRARL